MARSTTSTNESSASTRSQSNGLLQKLSAYKGSSAVAVLVSLLAVCAILLVGVLLYVFYMLAEDRSVSASSTAVTPDAVSDTTPHDGTTHWTAHAISTPSALASTQPEGGSDTYPEGNASSAAVPTDESSLQPTATDDASSTDGNATQENLTTAEESTAPPTAADNDSTSIMPQPASDPTVFPEPGNESTATPADSAEVSVTAEDQTDLVTYTEMANESCDLITNFSIVDTPDVNAEFDAPSFGDISSLLSEWTQRSKTDASGHETEGTLLRNHLQTDRERADTDVEGPPLNAFDSEAIINTYAHRYSVYENNATPAIPYR
ncbi:hypothetical protein HPB51_023199 [Rhipicephalus microplus]|uniref:Uncharacterized protein n=1 Tax=Rhipicephalus microplus TaxID=6941 RepID=A0A9J6DK52_RHIMP|nr:hypothetical protein HPB51_023199 [Rhipicephalus microplus]